MNILMILSKEILTDYRVYIEAKTLVNSGYNVTVIVWNRQKEYATEEVIDGIKIFRIYNSGLMKVLPSDLFRNPLWWRRAYKKALELYENGNKFEVVHCHDLDTLQIGVWLKRRLKVKLIYDIHDLFFLYRSVKNFRQLVVSFEKKLIKVVDFIITVNERVMEFYRSLTDRPIGIIMNCKNLVSKEYIRTQNKTFTVAYIGVLSKERFFPELVDIVGSIGGTKFLIAGKKENIWKEVMERCRQYKNVEYLGTISSTDVIPLTSKADCVIGVCNPTDPGTKFMLMNKQFEAMVCGRPIIVAKGTYAAEITEKLKCGLAVEYNGKAIREAIVKLRDNPELCEELGKNALKAAMERYNWKNEKKKLLKIYESL